MEMENEQNIDSQVIDGGSQENGSINNEAEIDLLKEYDAIIKENEALKAKNDEFNAQIISYTEALKLAEASKAKAEADKDELANIINHLQVSVKERKASAKDLVNQLLGG